MFLSSREDQPTHDHLLSIYLKSSHHFFSGKKGSVETILKANVKWHENWLITLDSNQSEKCDLKTPLARQSHCFCTATLSTEKTDTCWLHNSWSSVDHQNWSLCWSSKDQLRTFGPFWPSPFLRASLSQRPSKIKTEVADIVGGDSARPIVTWW